MNSQNNYYKKYLKYKHKYQELKKQTGGDIIITKEQIQTFISKYHLEKPNHILYIIDTSADIEQINKQMKQDDPITGETLTNIPTQFIIGIKDIATNNITSFITFQSSDHPILKNYIHVNFTFTFKAYRRKGYNKLLREFVEQFGIEYKFDNIASVVLPGADSSIVLTKMNYKLMDGNIYHKGLKSMVLSTRLIEMPQLCFGTLTQKHLGGNLTKSLSMALDIGYRHIDGADGYGGEEYLNIIKNIIKKVSRNELWITWKSDTISEENIKRVIEALECEYIDLFLIHHYYLRENWNDAFKTFKCVQSKGLISYYGVSNCENLNTLQRLKKDHNIFANQIQARPPKGRIDDWRWHSPPNFIEKSTTLGITSMIYGVNSGYSGLDNITDYDKHSDYSSKKSKYYKQKYIDNTNNVLMVSSRRGDTLQNNLDEFYSTDKLSSTDMDEIEKYLESIVLNPQ